MPFLVLLIAIAFQIFLTAKKLSPFLSLLLVAIVAGLMLGMTPAALLASIEKGVASTLGGLALILCLGAILGKILEISGAAAQISNTLIRKLGVRNIQWAMVVTGFSIGIPLFYNAGFIILVPLVFSITAATGLPLLYIAIPMAASLSVTHCFLPPHPGPVVLANAFGADIGTVLLYGLALAVPAVVIAGPLLGSLLKNKKAEGSPLLSPPTEATGKKLPAVVPSVVIALLPVLLISLAVVVNQVFAGDHFFKRVILFIGDSTIALLLSVLLAIWRLGIRGGYAMQTITEWLNKAVSGIAMILLIITAGGVLKQVLLDSGTGAYITSFSTQWQLSPLVFAWMMTALLRVCIGSATVAGITAAGVVAPLVAQGKASPELMVLAVGAGTVFGSHINDSGFWMFKEFFGLSLKQTFLSWTMMECLISFIGLLGVLLLQLIV